MLSPMRRAVLLGCFLLLCGCTSPLQQLRAQNPQATDFNSSLASEYLAYADSESEQGRKFTAEHYANKGLKALQGENVEPEAVDASLPAPVQDDLTTARAQLMALMNDNIKRTAPQQLARAQLLFDCWQHELDRRINQQLAPCEDEFKSVLADLQQDSDASIYNSEIEHKITFAKNSANLSAENHKLLLDIAKKVHRLAHYAVEIAAPDVMGARAIKLGNARLNAVHKVLAKAGVPEKHIRVIQSADDKKVYLSCDVSHDNPDSITVTVKTSEEPTGSQ